jgi:hypothetical protein
VNLSTFESRQIITRAICLTSYDWEYEKEEAVALTVEINTKTAMSRNIIFQRLNVMIDPRTTKTKVEKRARQVREKDLGWEKEGTKEREGKKKGREYF